MKKAFVVVVFLLCSSSVLGWQWPWDDSEVPVMDPTGQCQDSFDFSTGPALNIDAGQTVTFCLSNAIGSVVGDVWLTNHTWIWTDSVAISLVDTTGATLHSRGDLKGQNSHDSFQVGSNTNFVFLSVKSTNYVYSLGFRFKLGKS